MSLLFSLPVGRDTTNALERTLNAIEYVEDSMLILNCDIAINLDVIKRGLGEFLNTRVFINPTPRSFTTGTNLLEAHCTNYIYALELGIKFTHIYFLSDQDMFFRRGLYNFVKNYNAGFLMCSSHLKPNNWQEKGFADGDLWNQKDEPFWSEGLLLDNNIQRIYSDQIEGSFYCRELFSKIFSYLERLPVKYTQIRKSEYAEVSFGLLYLNLFIKEFPLYLPISTIYRTSDLMLRDNDILRIVCRENERQAMINASSYESFHSFTYGFKRVRYNESWHLKIKSIIEIAKHRLTSMGIDNTDL
jgi:hypothetical protein